MTYSQPIVQYSLIALFAGVMALFFVIWAVAFSAPTLKELRRAAWAYKWAEYPTAAEELGLQAFVLYYKTRIGKLHCYALLAVCVWLTLVAVAEMVRIFIEVNA
jgi:hypothetical protein